MTIANGKSTSSGGGIYNDRAKLTLESCVLSKNTAPDGGGIERNSPP